VKSAFAVNGGTAVVVPDEGGILSELKQLVPALITHEHVESWERRPTTMRLPSQRFVPSCRILQLSRAVRMEIAEVIH
jgi:hypothetical protein